MKKIWKSYKQTILLLSSLLIGAIIGLIFKEKATLLAPLGELFINIMFVLIPPLVFLTLTTSIAKIKHPKRLSKLLTSIVIVFIGTSVVALTVGLITTFSISLVKPENKNVLITSTETITDKVELNLLERTVSLISVDDFDKLLTKENLIALVVFSILVGIAIQRLGNKADDLIKVLNIANEVVLKLIDFAFLYAPIGLGCYFASLVGTFGNEIAWGYTKTFLLYLIVSLFVYFILYSLYAYLAAGKKGVKRFWQYSLSASATALATCSSAASIPMNIKSTKEIGVPSDIAEATIPLGTSFHKDGSIIGSVFKIMFLVYLFAIPVWNIENLFKIVITAIIANLLVSAVPIGGGTISEMMIITLMGFPIASLPILTIIATIIDPPATLLNVVGDTSSCMLVSRIMEGKNWLQEKDEQTKILEELL